jgi:L-methionine (R)-S-oxide reductase
VEAQQRRDLYQRVCDQLSGLFLKTKNPLSRMATAAALLHAKIPGFFWTGWYLIENGDLVVGPYQGPIACMVLPRKEGVCWAGVLRNETVIVPDVHEFEGHVACDSRSRSEIVVPLRNRAKEIIAVLDVDSTIPAYFDEIDKEGLERIVALIHA